ncbi:MAG: LuxE/PaaK family acyltransferase [Vulcanimicrobiaceae bacterium]
MRLGVRSLAENVPAMPSYHHEAQALDAEVLHWIDAWHRHGTPMGDAEFNDVATRIFAHQIAYNEPYGRYAASLGFGEATMPATYHAIPAVPAAAFKEATLATFDPAKAALAFETSGTTQGIGGRHFMESRDLYDASLLAGFDRFMLGDGLQLRYLNIVPNPADRSQSSLGYMMGRVSALRGDAQTGWYLRGDDLFFEAFIADLRDSVLAREPVCIASTAFGLVHIIDAMRERGLTLELPSGSRVMETGGFKGRTRVVDRTDLYGGIRECFGLPLEAIVAEYSMTELSSQYYDAPSMLAQTTRVKLGPPWLRARVVGPDGTTLPEGTVGALVHVDLANRSSCLAIATEDLAVAYGHGFILIGRERGAALRGCSLDAEELLRA